jgi:hypothetical protein
MGLRQSLWWNDSQQAHGSAFSAAGPQLKMQQLAQLLTCCSWWCVVLPAWPQVWVFCPALPPCTRRCTPTCRGLAWTESRWTARWGQSQGGCELGGVGAVGARGFPVVVMVGGSTCLW